MNLIYFFICLISCFIGAISGIGGGVIIKPILDSFGNMSISEISFLSGTTVLVMSIISLKKSLNKNLKLNIKIALFLGIGSGIGGFLGKYIFELFSSNFDNSKIGLIQSIILLIINVIILIYILNKHKIKSFNLSNYFICLLIGALLGIISSFLGIGGGPLNIAIIYILFSMPPKETAICSIFIVFISQITSFFTTIFNKVPNFNIITLLIMCFGAIIGALIGSNVSKKMDNKKIEKFFLNVLIFLIFLNLYNIFKFI